MESLENGILPVEGREVLTKNQEMMEAVAMGLRISEGIEIPWFNKKFHVSFHDLFKAPLETLTENHLVSLTDDRCSLSPKGLLLLNSIAGLLIQCF